MSATDKLVMNRGSRVGATDRISAASDLHPGDALPGQNRLKTEAVLGLWDVVKAHVVRQQEEEERRRGGKSAFVTQVAVPRWLYDAMSAIQGREPTFWGAPVVVRDADEAIVRLGADEEVVVTFDNIPDEPALARYDGLLDVLREGRREIYSDSDWRDTESDILGEMADMIEDGRLTDEEVELIESAERFQRAWPDEYDKRAKGRASGD